MYVENLWEKADHNVLASSAGHLLFFWMEVVSHLLSEAWSKIIAQLQTAVSERGKQGSGMQEEKQLEVGSENEKCSRITCACLANGR